MHTDMCVPCDDGYINIRVGAIIQKNGKILMAGNDRVEYLYSVGGRIQFGETAEETAYLSLLLQVYTDLKLLLYIYKLRYNIRKRRCGKNGIFDKLRAARNFDKNGSVTDGDC